MPKNLNNLTYKSLSLIIGVIGLVFFGASSILTIPALTIFSILSFVAAGIVAAIGAIKGGL